jgi:hypothetical protein
MDFGSLLLLLALIVIVAAFIASPLRHAPKREAVGEDDIELSQLLAERERVLDALAELDFDAEMGKVPDDLYPIQREALLRRGADVLRLLDVRMEEKETDEAERAARMERAASIRAKDDDPLEAMIASRRKTAVVEQTPAPTAEKAPAGKAHFCPNCGSALQPGDQFCSACGQKL